MNPPPPPSPEYACDPERGCITCSDEGIPMRVVEIIAPEGLAICTDDADRRSEVMTALVEPVALGDTLLVHAGTALAILTPQPPLPLAGEGVARSAGGEGREDAV